MTLWTYLQVTELDEIANVLDEGARIDLASLFSFAMMDGKQLEQRANAWNVRAHLRFESAIPDAVNRGRRMIDNILARGVLR